LISKQYPQEFRLMATTRNEALSDSEFAFVTESIIPEAEYAYRFAIGMAGLTPELAFLELKKIFQNLQPDIKRWSHQPQTNIRAEIIGRIYAVLDPDTKNKMDSVSLKILLKLNWKHRLAVVSCDLIELTLAEIGEKTNLSLLEVEQNLIQGRKKILGPLGQKCSDEFLRDIFVNSADADQDPGSSGLEQIADSQNDPATVLVRLRGEMQNDLQNFSLTPEQIEELINTVEPQDVRVTLELAQIQEAERSELLSSLKRRISILALISVIVFVIAYQYYKPDRSLKFEPLRHLTFETIAMMEDPQGRLDLAFGDRANDREKIINRMTEVEDFFVGSPDFTASPRVPQLDSARWFITGATVMDYESVKIGLVRFESNNGMDEPIFFYAFEGNLEDIAPKANEASMIQANGGRQYLAYGSDQLNFIFWQSDSKMVYVLVGAHSVQDLIDQDNSGG
jgi:hypothetical protein